VLSAYAKRHGAAEADTGIVVIITASAIAPDPKIIIVVAGTLIQDQGVNALTL